MVTKNHGIGGTDFDYKSTKTICDIDDTRIIPMGDWLRI